MARPKSLSNLSAQELADLRQALEQENARRTLLSSSNESVAAVVEAVKKTARDLKVGEDELLTAIVAIVLPNHDVYKRRGRGAGSKASAAPKKKPGRPPKKK